KLMGHKPQTITESVYMEKELQWSVYERAIIGMVDKGDAGGREAALVAPWGLGDAGVSVLVDQSTLAV
ncbi:hypothetical protein, partial [Acetobacter oeni]|uniref:hypothetical protein n=1 Tax=Acetobacter oeni TaxID=304077 RepID=UPI0022314EA8